MAKEVIMPKLGMTMEEGEILKWWKNEGEKVEKGETLLEANSGKANMEVEAPASGVLLKIIDQEGMVPVAKIIGIIGDEGENISKFLETVQDESKSKVQIAKAEKERNNTKTSIDLVDGIRSTPAAKYAAKQNNVDINKIKVNNKGFVSLKEVKEYLNNLKIRTTPVARRIAEADGISISNVSFSGERMYKEDVTKHINKSFKENLKGIKKATAIKMMDVWKNVPMVTSSVEVDVSKLLKLCENINSKLDKEETKVNLTDTLIKILAMSVKKNPQINVYINGEELTYNQEINIGIAVSIDNGLIVPIIKSVDTKGLIQINKEKKELVQKSKMGKLSLEDMTGGSITLSNMGMFGIEIFTPIINTPESCILGTGKIIKKPIVLNEEIVIRPMMWISLTFDHRILDGVPASHFLSTIKKMMEEPELLLM